MIKTITKFFAFATILKNLLETKKGDISGNTQIHPSKFPGRTIFVREKEYFIRESYVDGTTPIVFLHSWGSDSLGSWFKVLPKIKNKNSFRKKIITYYVGKKKVDYTIKDKNILNVINNSINLVQLLLNEKKGISKKNILSIVWNYSSDADTHTVETHIYRLRKKINEKFSDENFILNSKLLSESRKKAAIKLSEKINNELPYLKLENAIFDIKSEEIDFEDCSIDGIDRVIFFASTNTGMDKKPINKIASCPAS